MTLLDSALKACGGLERWNRFERFEVHVSIGGSYLASKFDATNLKEIVVSGYMAKDGEECCKGHASVGNDSCAGFS